LISRSDDAQSSNVVSIDAPLTSALLAIRGERTKPAKVQL
jgi:hypothetical protein